MKETGSRSLSCALSCAQVIAAMEKAEKEEKPSLANLFTDVYHGCVLTPNLMEQSLSITDAVRRNPSAYPQDIPIASSPSSDAPR